MSKAMASRALAGQALLKPEIVLEPDFPKLRALEEPWRSVAASVKRALDEGAAIPGREVDPAALKNVEYIAVSEALDSVASAENWPYYAGELSKALEQEDFSRALALATEEAGKYPLAIVKAALVDRLSEPSEKPAYKISTAFQIEAATLPPRIFYWLGLTPGFNLLIAKKGIGKSALALELAYNVARGTSYLRQYTRKTNVLYLGLELDMVAIKERLARIGRPVEGLFFAFDWPREKEALALARRTIERLKIGFLIIDMGLAILPLGVQTNDYSISELFREWRRLGQETECAILGLWHSVKNRADRSDFLDQAMGSTGVVGQSDTIFMLDRKRSESGGRLLWASNHAEGGAVPVVFNEGRYDYDDAAQGSGGLALTPAERPILEALKKAGGPLALAELAKKVNRGPDNVRDSLKGLDRKGLVNRPARGVYGLVSRAELPEISGDSGEAP